MGKVKGQKFAKGKSKKDTWKKLKHGDVDEFLKDLREDERLGIKDKPNEELFSLDVQGSDSYFKAANNQKRVTRQTRNKDGPLVNLDSLRCFQILKSDSAVKDPVIKRNRTKLPGVSKSVDMKLKDEIRRYKKEQQKQEILKSKVASLPIDPWSSPSEKAVASVLDNEWLTEETKRNIVRNRSVHKVKKPTTQIQAVEPPHPGLSVNPSFVDHQAILKETIDITKAEIIKEQRIQRATCIPKSAKIEGSDDLDVKEEIEIKSEVESDEDDSKAGIVRPKAKTKSKRNKARKLNEQQQAAKAIKDRHKREAEVFRIKSLRKEILSAEKVSSERLKKKVDRKLQHEKFGQLSLSKHKFVPLKPDPLLSEELGGTLLADAKNSVSDLTLERFKSLQKRNLIEPRVKQQGMKRKYKLKEYQRPSEKMEWEKTGMWNGEKLLVTHTRRTRRLRRV